VIGEPGAGPLRLASLALHAGPVAPRPPEDGVDEVVAAPRREPALATRSQAAAGAVEWRPRDHAADSPIAAAEQLAEEGEVVLRGSPRAALGGGVVPVHKAGVAALEAGGSLTSEQTASLDAAASEL